LALQTALEASYFGITENVPEFIPEATNPVADYGNQKVEAAPINVLIEQLIASEKQLKEPQPAIPARA
jgi:PmbA protein